MAFDLWVLREQKQLSVASLAGRAGLPIGRIMEYEAGRRSIDPRHLSRLARALYVEEAQIKLRSDPRPGAEPLEHNLRRELPVAAPARERELSSLRSGRERAPRPSREPLPPGPARPSQIAQLEALIIRLGHSKEETEQAQGKPLAALNRIEASTLLKTLQDELAASDQSSRRRAYLPESVDEHEANYLAELRDAGDGVTFTLFDGQVFVGSVAGFGPYSILIRLDDGSELTLNKLAIVSYRRPKLTRTESSS